MSCESVSHSVVSDSATLWTIACQAPLSMKFSQLEYWSGLPCPSTGDILKPGIKHRSPALQVDSLPAQAQGKPKNIGVGSLTLLKQISPTQELTGVSCIAGGFFTN